MALAHVVLSFLALLQSAPPAADAGQSLEKLQAVEKRIAAERKWLVEFRSGTTSDEDRAQLLAAFPKDELVGELTAIALGAKGQGVAALAWLDVLRLGCLLDDRELFTRALDRLLAEHMKSPEILYLTLELTYGAPSWTAPQAAAALRRLLAENDDEDVRANVLGQLALLVGLDDSFGAEGRAEASALLAKIEEEYGDREYLGGNGKQFAEGARFEMEHLRVGQVAPEFEVPDQHGERFKLSDYRGRVVLLDFWGFV